ncbi:hypothetical protein L1987_79404 [Smallanthus sonchifolius]|uniref:Uncharacterized protein n=1 Tax=Smallanthus sonchifolius TaxID=185202 RepID=A0ACB8ZGE2_9ASTR|nr:hypothetical protein L1987_79404 [Smallanthus sonchifolius]
MASEADVSVSTLIQRLIAMPLLAAFATAGSEPDQNHSSENPDLESMNRQSIDRIILINPLTQQMTVIGGNGSSFDSVLNSLVTKEGQPPASQASIDGMPVVEVKGADEIESLGGECAICLEEWAIGDVAKEMPCKHRFHGGCVDRWLRIHGSCPVYKMPADDLDKKIGDESGRRRRREVWVALAVGNGGLAGEEEGLNEESLVESRES